MNARLAIGASGLGLRIDIGELAGIIFPPPAREKMVMLAAYFDENGTHADSRATAVGGFLATTNQWQKFEKAWAAALQRAGVGLYHATDLETFRGEFLGWDPPKKIRLQTELISIIKRHCSYATSC